MKKISKKIIRNIKKRKIRKKIKGTSKHPRLSIFRSAKHISAQIIDDQRGITLTSVRDSELNFKKPQSKKITKTDIATKTGQLLAQKAKKKKISKVVFDRSGFKFHGRVKALANGARKQGLNF